MKLKVPRPLNGWQAFSNEVGVVVFGVLGHDLILSLDEAELRGFVSTVPKLRSVVERLRDMHFRHQFRYGGMESLQMPALDESVATLDALAREIGKKLRTIVVPGRMPFAESGLTIRKPRRSR